MKKIALLITLSTIFACNELVEKPEHLLSKEQISDVLVDIAINEQATLVNPNANMEIGTRYILKKHEISPKEFIDSYKYYTLNKDLPNIVEKAQEKLLESHPELKSKIVKNEKQDELNQNDIKIIEGADTPPSFKNLKLSPLPQKKGKGSTPQKKNTKDSEKTNQLPKLEDLNPKTEQKKPKNTIKKEDIEAIEGSDTPQF